ncbi:MAG: c-type cytochrome, partial [Fuerstiella sp.]|nr:c-type cytochrome [Fuerstiella sp.]
MNFRSGPFLPLFVLWLFVLFDTPLPVNAQPRRPFVVQDPPKSPREQLQTFHLPEGFKIELVASEPQIINPINLNFDARGSLYVSQSIEYPIPAPADRPGRDKLLRLVDTNNDGVPDRVETFAEQLNIPIGVTPVPGGVLGYTVPKLFFFDESGNDRTRRHERFGDFGFNDTHGMVSSLTWWIDGWVYGCHGFVNTSEISGSDGNPITMMSGNTYCLRPDGSRIEHYSHGQVNPFGLTIDPWGNVFTSDCHTRPATMLLPRAHYPRSPGDGLGHGPELMQHSHGSTGIAGIVYYEAEHFPEAYRGSLFIGNPITGRINLDRLKKQGSTYTAIQQDDFLTCDDLWFRPVDLQPGPDGALYIADMYNGIIGHYEVPLSHPKRDRKHGRIWRISYDDGNNASSPKQTPADLTKATADELIHLLADGNLVRRTHATHQLVERVGVACAETIRALLSADSAETQRAHGLWVLQRLGQLTAADWYAGITDKSPLVRLHAVKVLAEATEWDERAIAAILARLDDSEAFVVRAAVEALAKHPIKESVTPLLSLLAMTDAADSCLVHSARITLRDTLREVERFDHWQQVFSDSPEHLMRLADVAVGIPSPAAAEFLWSRFSQDQYPLDRRADVLRHIVRNIDADTLPDVLALADTYTDRDPHVQIGVASAVLQGAQERGIKVPPSIRDWGERIVRKMLASDQAAQIQQGISHASQMRLSGLSKELLRLSDRSTPFPQARISAILALQTVSPAETPSLFFTIVSDEKDLPGLRQLAAEKLANMKVPEIRTRILKTLPTESHSIAVGFARGLIIDAAGAGALLDLVEQGKVSPQILQDGKVQRLLPVSGLTDAKLRRDRLTSDLPSLDARMQQLLRQRLVGWGTATPDVMRGAEVFRKNCSACHRIANQGEKVGPELDGVGQRGIERLLEDVLDPNRAVDKNFRATIVVTNAGQVFIGLAMGQQGQVLMLVDQTGKVQRIPVGEIEERKLINGSAMPSNFGETL